MVRRPSRYSALREYCFLASITSANMCFQEMKEFWQGDITEEKMAWQLHSLIDQIHVWAVQVFRPFVLDHLKPWHQRYISNRVENLRVERSLNPRLTANIYTFPLIDRDDGRFNSRTTFNNSRIPASSTTPKRRGNEENELDALDQELLKQRLETGSENIKNPLEGLPWWSGYAKAEVTRQKLLGARQPHNIPRISQRSSKHSRNRRQERKEYRRLQSEYAARESKQDAEKVQGSSGQALVHGFT